MNKRQKKRLLNVAKALRETQTPDDFRMSLFGNACGTPACALGHYASRTDLQKAFVFRVNREDAAYNKRQSQAMLEDPSTYRGLISPHVATVKRPRAALWYDGPEILEHFGITDYQAELIFGGHGCGGARHPDEAAQFIERFVEEQT